MSAGTSSRTMRDRSFVQLPIPSVIDVTRHHTHTQIMAASVATVVAAVDATPPRRQRFVKLTNKRCIHRDVAYHEGLVTLKEKFDPLTEHGSGLFFTREEHLQHWIMGAMKGEDGIMYYIWDVELPTDAKMVQVSDTCYKTDQIIIRNRREIWQSPLYCAQILRTFGFLLEYVDPRLKTIDLCSIAVAQNGFALRFVPLEIISDKLCWIAITHDPRTLSVVPSRFVTKEMCEKAVKSSAMCLKFVPDGLLTEELCMVAVSQFGAALQYVPIELRTKEICQVAFANDLTSFLPLDTVPERTIENWKERMFQRPPHA